MFKFIKNKKLRIFTIILLILVILGTITVFIFSLLKDNYRSIYKEGKKLIYENTYNNYFNEIDINTKMSDIDIKVSYDNTFKVNVYGEENYININEKNNKLFIDINRKNIIAFDFYSCISKIELYIPLSYSDVIRIDSEFGNINIEEFNNSNLDVKQKYGDFKSLGMDFINLNNSYGNIDITKVLKARILSNYSNIIIKDATDLVIENKFGNINIEKVNEYLNLENENGNIKIDNINLIKSSFIDNNYGNIIIEKINEVKIDAKTDRGKVKIKNNYKQSKVLLNIYNKDGDIVINN